MNEIKRGKATFVKQESFVGWTTAWEEEIKVLNTLLDMYKYKPRKEPVEVYTQVNKMINLEFVTKKHILEVLNLLWDKVKYENRGFYCVGLDGEDVLRICDSNDW